ncbi:pyridoxine 5'-phosphate synthase [Brevundimonas aveniformis]|uniref:pyridoxine 5'-phosphate synthase n=1 Tax=Brevundimonas aveniformis TaxID=370977 RepID=UPI00048A6F47|nr:pyridoxine 5'-phosphate synthase [Brevundimonas aveniformis]
MGPLRLGVNIDHVATVRNARGGAFPDPLRAAEMALEAGADGITAHLREDRRHISDLDIARLTDLLESAGRPLNLEMAVTDEMIGIALKHRPHAVCLVPERREERTTEGGLDVAGQMELILPAVRRLRQAGSRVSLFVGADPGQVEASAAVGAQVVELHTGAFCDFLREGRAREAGAALDALRNAASQAGDLGLEVHAGHGLDYETAPVLAGIPQVVELNIGHFLIGEGIFVGLTAAIRRMRAAMDAGRAEIAG